jgi:hypothetical protein
MILFAPPEISVCEEVWKSVPSGKKKNGILPNILSGETRLENFLFRKIDIVL